MPNIKLIAVDLDGTLFNHAGKISAGNYDAIRQAVNSGVSVVISTGRPFCGLPFDQIKGSGIRYAITTNGSAIYDVKSGECLFETCMENEIFLPIAEFLLQKDVHFDAFIGGNAFSPTKCLPVAHKLDMPESLKHYIITTRTRIDDFPAYVREHPDRVQKVTINFYPDADGVYHDREAVAAYLAAAPHVDAVCGGYHNLEFTKTGITKGATLLRLAALLQIRQEETMAIGDTENDLSILKTAAIGVAMGNASPDVLAAADFVTRTNEEDGVAHAIRKYLRF